MHVCDIVSYRVSPANNTIDVVHDKLCLLFLQGAKIIIAWLSIIKINDTKSIGKCTNNHIY